MKYTVETTQYGILIYGELPISHMHGISAFFKPEDKAVMHPGIANHYGAVICVVPEANVKEWETEVESRIASLPREERWIRGLGVGVSAKTIFAALADEHYARTVTSSPRFTPTHPHDADDFSRCYKLLQIFPEWRPRLPEVGAKYPETMWSKLASEWDLLETLYVTGRRKELSAKIARTLGGA